MLFNNLEFKAMQSGLDALWLKQRVISDNIANYETPGYKAKSVEFEDLFNSSIRQYNSGKHSFKVNIKTDEESSERPDGNNVNMEKESIELWKAYSQYSYLSQKVSQQLKNMRYVINQALK